MRRADAARKHGLFAGGAEAYPPVGLPAEMGRARNDTTERGLKVRPPEAADAGLVYASDDEPGIRGVRKGKGFTYFGPDGKRVTGRVTLERIRGLVIPPAWKD